MNSIQEKELLKTLSNIDKSLHNIDNCLKTIGQTFLMYMHVRFTSNESSERMGEFGEHLKKQEEKENGQRN